MVQRRLGCKWSGFWMGSEIRKLNHLKSGQMANILSKTIWNLDRNVQFLNGWEFTKQWGSEIWPFEIPPSKSLDFKWSDFRSPLYNELVWNLLLGKMSGIQVMKYKLIFHDLNSGKMPVIQIQVSWPKKQTPVRVGVLVPIIRIQNPFEYRTFLKVRFWIIFDKMAAILSNTIPKPNKTFGFWVPFENPDIFKTNLRSSIWVPNKLGIRIPTVFRYFL